MEQFSKLTRPIRSGHSLTLTTTAVGRIVEHYQRADRRLLLFDYDGVLSELIPDISPTASQPPAQLLGILAQLAGLPGNELMVVSGRPRAALESWFGGLGIGLAAEHGAWTHRDGVWRQEYELATAWKAPFHRALDAISARTPGASVEHKDFSLVWHYRGVSPHLAAARESALYEQLVALAAGSDIGVFRGHKIIEIKPRFISKGTVVRKKLVESPRDFIMAIGDDYNDEAMFAALPASAITIKVGSGRSGARYRLGSVGQVHELIQILAAVPN